MALARIVRKSRGNPRLPEETRAALPGSNVEIGGGLNGGNQNSCANCSDSRSLCECYGIGNVTPWSGSVNMALTARVDALR